MNELVGHDAAWREFRAAMQSPRMHHAWMLTGLKGLGKGSFARAAAAELVAEPGIPQPPVEAHPDILIPEHPPENKEEAKKREDGGDYRRKRAIPIEEIRTLIQRLHTRPTLGSRRVVIIDPADGTIFDANQAAEVFYGYNRERLTAMQIYDLNVLPKDEVLAELAKVRSGKQIHFFFLHYLLSLP